MSVIDPDAYMIRSDDPLLPIDPSGIRVNTATGGDSSVPFVDRVTFGSGCQRVERDRDWTPVQVAWSDVIVPSPFATQADYAAEATDAPGELVAISPEDMANVVNMAIRVGRGTETHQNLARALSPFGVTRRKA